MVRDTIAAAITARLGPARELSHTTVPWHSATFDGALHHFMFQLESIGDLAAAAARLAEDDIAIHSGFVADVAVIVPDPAHPGEVRVEALVVNSQVSDHRSR